MTQVIGISAVTVGTVATLRDNICGVVGSPMAGAWQTVSNPLQGLPFICY